MPQKNRGSAPVFLLAAQKALTATDRLGNVFTAAQAAQKLSVIALK